MIDHRSYFLAKAQKYCAQGEQCAFTVRKKLMEWQAPKEDIEAIVEMLTQECFLDEQRYAVAFAQGKFRMLKWGKIKIGYQLQQYQISKQVIEAALATLTDNRYKETLHTIAVQKWKTIEKSGNTLQKKQKLMLYLASKGFENSLIQEVMNSITASK